MSQELVIKSRTEIKKDVENKDIFSLYGVPAMLDKCIEKKKKEMLDFLTFESTIDVFKNSHSEDFIVEFPREFNDMMKSGEAFLDKSSKHPGGYTPNIRIKGEKGIKGQATIVKNDSKAFTQCFSSLVKLAQIQSTIEKLDIIAEGIDDIKKGQENDRIGAILGAFKSFMILYPRFRTTEEFRNSANDTFSTMHHHLAQLHLYIEEIRKKLEKAPTNNWQAFWLSLCNPTCNKSKYYQECFDEFIYNIQIYNRLILLSDFILILKGEEESIKKNHETIIEYCDTSFDEGFRERMNYLKSNDTKGIDIILESNKEFTLALDTTNRSLSIECKSIELE